MTQNVPSPKSHRFEFLDAARGIAVLTVVFQHLGEFLSPAFREFTFRQFNFGTYGVVLFFLVSGFIIPFSLERIQSVKLFWINRVFRLHPLYLLTLVLVTAGTLAFPSLMEVSVDYRSRMGSNFWINFSMVQNLLGRPNAIELYWTLTYEMVFYVACSLLFLTPWRLRTDILIWIVNLAFLGFLAQCLVTHHDIFPVREFRIATFFVGTLVYRGWTQQMEWRPVLLALVPFLLITSVLAILSLWVYGAAPTAGVQNVPSQAIAWALAYATFGLLLWGSSRVFPVWLSYLGRISYSIYLLHGLLFSLVIPDHTMKAVVILVGTAILSPLTYRYVEEPAISMGKGLVARLR